MQASVWFRAERVPVSADRRSTPPIGEDSPEGTLDVASARTQQPDVIFSRDGGTLEVSISRRGVHRLGVVGAVALSAWVVWGVTAPLIDLDHGQSSPPGPVDVSQLTPSLDRLAFNAASAQLPVALTVVPAPTVASSVAVETPRDLPVKVAPSPLPAATGFVISVDGSTTDLRFELGASPLSATGNWTFEAWLRPSGSSTGTVYAEAGFPEAGNERRMIWIDGTDIRASHAMSDGSRGSYVARGAAGWKPNEWHHLGVTWAGGKPTVVIDGTVAPTVFEASGSEPGERDLGKTSVGLLLPVTTIGGFAGSVDDVRLWSSTRTVADLTAGRNARIAADTRGLYRYFAVSAGAGNGASLSDATGRGTPLQFVTGARWTWLGDEAPRESESTTAKGSVAPAPPYDLTMDRGAEPTRPVATGAITFDDRSWVLDGGARPSDGGWLRLTDATPMKLGVARYERDLPLGGGLTIRFAYRASGVAQPAADGVVAFLWDPAYAPFAPGYGGGSLGYGRYCGSGLSGAVVGVGIDLFGTFGSSEPTCNDGIRGRAPNAVSVRGPGNGREGYDLVATSRLRRDVARVGADGAVIDTTILIYPDATITVQTRFETETVPIDDIKRVPFLPSGAPIPPLVRVGFAGATGGLVGVHDLRDVVIRLGTD